MRFQDVRRTLFTIHMWVGLILGLLLAALGLSGSLLVYDDRVSDLLMPAPRAQTAGQPLPLSMIQDIAARAAAEKGVAGQMQIVLPDDEDHAVSVRMAGMSPMGNMPGMPAPPKQLQLFLDPVSGAVLGTRTALQPAILTFAHQLHGNFLMGREARPWVVGPLGVAMCLLGLTGLVLWWPKRGQWKYAFFVRRTATGLRFHRELHAATGIWIFLVFMIVSFSGVVIAWPQTMGMNPPPRAPVAVDPQNLPVLGASAAVTAAQKALPGAELRSVTIPAKPGQAINVAVLAHGAINAQVLLNPYTGAVLQVRDPSENAMAWQRPIHQGTGFGAVWKFLVFLSGLVPVLFVITGMVMWAKKRQRRLPMTMPTDEVADEA